MSVLPNATNQTLVQPWFATLGIQPTSVNPTCAISTLTSDHIVLDGQTLDCTSQSGGTLLLNGVAIANVNQNVSSIANWASYPALSTITYSTGGGSGGDIKLNTAAFSTLQVSSINGQNPTNALGVLTAISTAHAVLDGGVTTPQVVAFTNDNTVTIQPGIWYEVTAIISTGVPSVYGASDRWTYRVTSSGGSLTVANDSMLYYAPQVWAYNQNSTGVSNTYYYTQFIKGGTSGTLTLSVAMTLPSGTSQYQWNCSSFRATPLGTSLN